jgi:hypothetical protein
MEKGLIEPHMEKLDFLQPVKDPKEVNALPHLQLTIQSHITAQELRVRTFKKILRKLFRTKAYKASPE